MLVRDQRTWVFNSADAFSGNPKWLFAYVLDHRPDIDPYWLAHSAETVEAIRDLGYPAHRFTSPKGLEIMSRAGVYVVNQVKEHLPEEIRGATLLNLWHGVGVKNIERRLRPGYLTEQVARKYIRFNRLYRETQLFLVTSPLMEAHFREQVGLDDEVIIRGGYPQNLYRARFGNLSTFDHDIRGAAGAPADARIAMWCPTPRRSARPGLVLEAFPDPELLIKVLEASNTLLVLKMHPHLEKDEDYLRLKREYGHSPWLHFWDNADDVYEVFDQVDLAIVDYSSILYDMLAAGVRHVIRYAFDIDGGDDTIETALDYEAMSCGVLVRDFDSLLDLLGRPCEVPEDELSRVMDLFWSYSTPDTFETLVDRALTFRRRNVDLPTLYSFDVFDTLVHRRGIEPRSVFFLVQSRMRSSPIGFPAQLCDTYPEIRAQAEAAVRNTVRRTPGNLASGRLEIAFDAILTRMRDLYDLTDEQVHALRRWELEAEQTSCVPDVDRIAQVRRLVEAGERVVLVSDMYLPRAAVTDLLCSADALLGELPLYLSSDYGVQKSTRKLYLQIYQDIGYDFGEWVHTGDNEKADRDRARELGIRPVTCPTPRLDALQRDIVRHVPTFDGFLLADLYRRMTPGEPRTPAEHFVIRFVAMNLVPYVDWTLRHAVGQGRRCLYFVSRDGHYLKIVADALIEAYGYDVRTHYIYGSRAAWRVAAQVDHVDDDTFDGYGSLVNAHSGTALLRAARLSVEEFADLFPGFSEYATAEDLPRTAATAIVEAMSRSQAFRDHFLAVAAEERELVTDYLRQEMDLQESFAVVEYWGRGYTQDCLVRLVAEAAGRRLPVPFYYARSIYQTDGEAIRHNFTAAQTSLIPMEAVLANLPYGSTLGYARADGGVVPVADARVNDETVQRALESVLPEMARLFAETDFEDRDGVARSMFRFAFVDFRQNAKHPDYAGVLGPLRDAVELGSAEAEFAPAFSVVDVIRHRRGSLPVMSRSFEMSLHRSSMAFQYVVRLNRRFRIKRRAIRVAHRVTRPGRCRA